MLGPSYLTRGELEEWDTRGGPLSTSIWQPKKNLLNIYYKYDEEGNDEEKKLGRATKIGPGGRTTKIQYIRHFTIFFLLEPVQLFINRSASLWSIS